MTGYNAPPVTAGLERHADIQARSTGRWMPDRKVWSSVLGGVVTVALGTVLPAVGIPIPPEIVAPAVTMVTGLVGFFVPPSDTDLLRRAPDTVAVLKEAQ